MQPLRQKVIQPENQSIKLIPLTKNQVAIVDAHWFEALNRFNWCASWDKRAQTFYASRYAVVDGKRTSVLMHRVIAGDNFPHVDHRNRNGLDNREENLRKCSCSQNGANCGKRKSNTTGFKGVYALKGTTKFAASIKFRGKTKSLGRFKTKELAARAYDRAAILFFGEFASPNFPHSDYSSFNV
jgi:hypothetical protein